MPTPTFRRKIRRNPEPYFPEPVYFQSRCRVCLRSAETHLSGGTDLQVCAESECFIAAGEYPRIFIRGY
jgi:hypothetical protein